MQSAYFTVCVSEDPGLFGLEEESHAPAAIAQTASAAIEARAASRAPLCESHRTVDNFASCNSFTFAIVSLTQSLSMMYMKMPCANP
jgi:hypothetical protein